MAFCFLIYDRLTELRIPSFKMTKPGGCLWCKQIPRWQSIWGKQLIIIASFYNRKIFTTQNPTSRIISGVLELGSDVQIRLFFSSLDAITRLYLWAHPLINARIHSSCWKEQKGEEGSSRRESARYLTRNDGDVRPDLCSLDLLISLGKSRTFLSNCLEFKGTRFTHRAQISFIKLTTSERRSTWKILNSITLSNPFLSAG